MNWSRLDGMCCGYAITASIYQLAYDIPTDMPRWCWWIILVLGLLMIPIVFIRPERQAE